MEQSVGILHDDRGAPQSFVSQIVDITDAKRSRDRLQHLATRDGLTELLNRRELHQRISDLADGEDLPRSQCAVLFIDIDNFKNVNDEFGHAIGDGVIVAVAGRIRGSVRSGDIVGRAGGDEFVVVLTDVPEPDEAVCIAEKIRESPEDPVHIDGTLVPVTVSIGVAPLHQGDDPNAALRHADQALYEAKRNGRNRVETYNGDHSGDVQLNAAAGSDVALTLPVTRRG